MAIDRDLITSTVLNGALVGVNSVIPPSLPGYREFVCDNWEYNPAQPRSSTTAPAVGPVR